MSENPQYIPAHIGLILDGNRRWASEHSLPALKGHQKGYENLKIISEHAFRAGVKYVSVFCFSTENWNRSKEEVSYLLDLAQKVISRDAKKLAKAGIRIIIMGERTGMPQGLIEDGRKLMDSSKHNTKGTLVICFNYGGKQELTESIRSIIKAGVPANEITTDVISNHLYFPEVPPVDLLIRTSGEQRISNFMLWRAAYAELLFVKKHWPDFTTEDLDAALEDYANRSRRFGGN